MKKESPVAVPVFVALFMAAALAILGVSGLESARENSFRTSAANDLLAVENRLRVLGRKTTATAAAMRLKPELSQEEFRRHLLETSVMDEQPYLSALIDIVSPDKLSEWSDRIAALNGWNDFQVAAPGNTSGNLYPVRYSSHEVQTFIPGSLNEADWDRSAIVEMAESYEGPYLGQIRQTTGGKTFFPYSTPFYTNQMDNPAGFVLMQIDLAGFLEQAISSNGSRALRITIEEEDTGNSWQLARGQVTADPQPGAAGLSHTGSIILPGASWALTFEPMPGFYEPDWGNLALTAVTAIALVLLALSFLVRNRETQIQLVEKVEERTSDLKKALQAAELANKSKTRFLGSISHELKTPLNSIIGFSEILESETAESSNDQHNEYARHILNGGHRLLGAVNNILALTKVEAGEIKPVRSEINVDASIARIAGQFAEECREKDLALTVNATCGDAYLVADANLLQQTLNNLLSNALKFTPTGGSIDAGAKTGSDGTLEIYIADSGRGMTSEELENALLPFEQVEDLYIRKHEGVGLGLPLARAFTELNGGDLKIKAAHGKGTTVSLIFPPELLVEPDDSDFV